MTTMFLKTKQEYDNVNDKHKTELREKLKRHIEIGIFFISRFLRIIFLFFRFSKSAKK